MSIPFFNKFIGFKNTPIFYIRKSRFSTFNFKFWSSCFRSNKQKIRSKILNFIHFNKSCPKIGWIFNLNQFYRESSLIKPNNIHKLYRIGNNWWISKRRNDFYSCQPSYLFIFKNTIFRKGRRISALALFVNVRLYRILLLKNIEQSKKIN